MLGEGWRGFGQVDSCPRWGPCCYVIMIGVQGRGNVHYLGGGSGVNQCEGLVRVACGNITNMSETWCSLLSGEQQGEVVSRVKGCSRLLY